MYFSPWSLDKIHIFLNPLKKSHFFVSPSWNSCFFHKTSKKCLFLIFWQNSCFIPQSFNETSLFYVCVSDWQNLIFLAKHLTKFMIFLMTNEWLKKKKVSEPNALNFQVIQNIITPAILITTRGGKKMYLP